jgi:hypothetical protein
MRNIGGAAGAKYLTNQAATARSLAPPASEMIRFSVSSGRKRRERPAPSSADGDFFREHHVPTEDSRCSRDQQHGSNRGKQDQESRLRFSDQVFTEGEDLRACSFHHAIQLGGYPAQMR